MEGGPSLSIKRWRILRRLWPWFLLACCLGFVRWSKGSGFSDAYTFLTRPFWPGTAQREWLQKGLLLEQKARLDLLQKDNLRLREMLALQSSSSSKYISAPVVFRNSNGWWQQLELGKGSIAGVKPGLAVVGPGGLLGIVQSVTPTTARVRLLTAPGSQVGVWVDRVRTHGLLLGMGTNRPQLSFLDKNPKVLEGDLVSTSPASTLLPPNLPIGVIQFVDREALPTPTANVQLIAAPEAIDWVQVKKP